MTSSKLPIADLYQTNYLSIAVICSNKNVKNKFGNVCFEDEFETEINQYYLNSKPGPRFFHKKVEWVHDPLSINKNILVVFLLMTTNEYSKLNTGFEFDYKIYVLDENPRVYPCPFKSNSNPPCTIVVRNRDRLSESNTSILYVNLNKILKEREELASIVDSDQESDIDTNSGPESDSDLDNSTSASSKFTDFVKQLNRLIKTTYQSKIIERIVNKLDNHNCSDFDLLLSRILDVDKFIEFDKIRNGLENLIQYLMDSGSKCLALDVITRVSDSGIIKRDLNQQILDLTKSEAREVGKQIFEHHTVGDYNRMCQYGPNNLVMMCSRLELVKDNYANVDEFLGWVHDVGRILTYYNPNQQHVNSHVGDMYCHFYFQELNICAMIKIAKFLTDNLDYDQMLNYVLKYLQIKIKTIGHMIEFYKSNQPRSIHLPKIKAYVSQLKSYFEAVVKTPKSNLTKKIIDVTSSMLIDINQMNLSINQIQSEDICFIDYSLIEFEQFVIDGNLKRINV